MIQAKLEDDVAEFDSSHPSLANQTFGQIESAASVLVMEDPGNEVLRWLDLSAALLTRAKQIRNRVEDVAIQHILAHGPLIFGEVQYSVGQPLVVSCIDTEGCTRDLLEAVGGDLGVLTSYYRSEPFKYGSVRQLLGEERFDLFFRSKRNPKLIEGKEQPQLVIRNQRFSRPSRSEK